VHAYRLPGYWADVGGSIGDFYKANMGLLKDPPNIDFDRPIETPLFKWVRGGVQAPWDVAQARVASKPASPCPPPPLLPHLVLLLGF
jgi:hypothetical protein